MAREMKDSGIEWIGSIPQYWVTTKIKYFFDCYDGKRVPVDAAQREKGPYPYWGAGSITDYVSDYLFDEEIVLLGEDGAPFFDHTRPVAFLINEKVWVNNHIHVLKLHSDVDARFFVHWLNNVDYKCYINGSILNKLTQSNMNAIAFACPPLEEQARIAAFLDRKCAEIDSVIADTQRTIEEYKKLKQSVITQAVTKGIRGERPMKDSGIEWIGDIPVDWSLCRIGSQYFERRTKVSDVDYPPLSVTKKGVVPQLETAAKTDAHDDRKLVRVGDFAINSRSDRRGSCGISGYEGSVSLINTILVPRDAMDPQYYEWLFHSVGFADEFYKWGHGIVDDLWTTGWQDMKKIVIPRPPMDEQREIAEYLESKCTYIDTLIDQKTQLLSELDAYRKSVIYEYVTGKKEVPACQ